MSNWYLTFGQRYRHERHPLGTKIHPDSYVRVEAPSPVEARHQVWELIGSKWAFLYSEEQFFSESPAREAEGGRTVDLFPAGCVGVIKSGFFHKDLK